MGESVTSRTLRADNYALSEETKRLRDNEQSQITDAAYLEAQRLLAKASRRARPQSQLRCSTRRRSAARSSSRPFAGVEPDSRSSESVGVVRAVNADPTG